MDLSRQRSKADRRVLEIGLSKKSLMQLEKSMEKICPIFEALDNGELLEYRMLTAKLAGRENSPGNCT